jgi:polygalacturonase
MSLLAAAGGTMCLSSCRNERYLPDDWDMADQIRRSIKTPDIPDRQFDLREFGAIGDGSSDCSTAFSAAIADTYVRTPTCIFPRGRQLRSFLNQPATCPPY